MRRLLTALSCAVVVSVIPSTALARVDAPRFKRYEEPRFAFSVAVPARWETHREGDPGFHQMYGGAYPASVKFAALEPNVQRFTIGFRVNVFPGYRGTLREHARNTLLSYRPDPNVPLRRSPRNTIVSSGFVQLPAGRAWRLKARFAQSANNGVDTVSHLEYDFVRNSRLYIFWYDAIQSVEAKYAPLFDRSARSIRLGN